MKSDELRIGIDLGGSKIEAALLGPKGSILERIRHATPRHDYDATLKMIRKMVDELDGPGGALPVGIGTPGAVSPATGRIKNANSVWLNNRPLLRDLTRTLARPVRLANDADCFALSEAVDGAAREAEVVFGVILGTGVGGGIVVRRRLLSGPNAICGEWGHNPLPWPRDDERPGPSCYCGKQACIETFLSGPGLARDHMEAGGERLQPEEIVSGATEGDEAAEKTLERYEERLGRSLATVVNLLDPSMIVLGGGLSGLDRLYGRLPAVLSRYVFTDRVDTLVVPPVHGDSGGVRGAAWLWGRPNEP